MQAEQPMSTSLLEGIFYSAVGFLQCVLLTLFYFAGLKEAVSSLARAKVLQGQHRNVERELLVLLQ